jgi:muconolactone D-isomerase
VEFLVRIDVHWPPDGNAKELAVIVEAERAAGGELVRTGVIRRVWRVPGRWANWGIWAAADATELHAVLSSLPLYPWLEIIVHPLAAHPIDPGPGPAR